MRFFKKYLPSLTIAIIVGFLSGYIIQVDNESISVIIRVILVVISLACFDLIKYLVKISRYNNKN